MDEIDLVVMLQVYTDAVCTKPVVNNVTDLHAKEPFQMIKLNSCKHNRCNCMQPIEIIKIEIADWYG